MNHTIQAFHDVISNIVHLIPGHTLISKSGVSLSIIIPSLVLYWLPSSYVKESQRVASPPPPTTSDPLVEDAVPEDPSPIVSPVPVSEEPSTALVLTPPASPIPPTPQALPVTFVAPVDPVTLPLPASPPLPPPQPLPVTFIAPVDPATLLLPASPPPPTPQVLPVEPAPLEDSEEAELVPLETSEAVETREVADHAEQIMELDDMSPALEPELATTTTAAVPEAIEVKSTTASIPPTATSVTTKEVSGASADEAHGFIHKLFHRSKTQKEAGPGNVAEALKPLNKEPSQDFESFWDSLPARDCLFAKESSKSFRAILSTPICSEDIQDVETVLREDREKGASSWDLCLIFRIRIPQEPIYGKTQDQDFFIRMGFQIKDSWTAGTTTDMFTRCDSRRPATDVRIRRQALQGFKVYHLLDLVNLACARGGWELERENPLRVRSSIGEGLMGSHLTQILADSLRPWHVGSPETFELEKPLASHASEDNGEDRLERAQTQRDAIFAKLEEAKAEMLTHTIRLTMKFMRHWGDWPWKNATGPYEPDSRTFSEHSWSGHPLLFPRNYHPIVRTRSDPRQQMTRSTISLDMFYDSIMGTNSAPEINQIAFAEIDEIKIYRDDNTGVKHEFLVVCAKSQYESGETTSWVRIDRGQGRSTDGIWNANDTILCGSTPGGWLINRQSVQEISSLYLGGSVSRRPLVRDLVHAVGVLHKTFPEYTWHQHNCWFVANLITMTMRCLYGGEWIGDEAHWVWPQELHDFVTLCIDDLNFTRFNLGGLPETFPVIPVEQLFPTKDVFGRKTTHKSALPRVFSLLAHGAGAEASTSAAHSGSSGNKTKSATSTPSQSKVSSTTAVGDHKGTHTRASERTSESANSITDSASTASSSAASEAHQAYGSQAIGPLGAMKRSWHDHRVFKSFAIAKSRFSPVKNLPDTVIKQPDSPKHFFSKRKSVV